MKMKKIVLLAVAQVAEGTPGTPVPGTNAILCRGLTPTPIKGKFVPRNLLLGSKGNQGALFAGEYRSFDFEVELAGSGTAGTAPKFAPLLMGCATSETLSAGVSAVYQPIAVDGPFITLFCYLDGLLFKLTDAMGSVSLALNAEDIPVQKYTYIGKYEPMTDTAFPTGSVFTAFTKPVTVGKTNTTTFTLAGLPLVVKSFDLDLANKVEWVDLINRSGARSEDRTPTAKAVFELTTVAAKDWAETVRIGTYMPLAIVHGVTAGNICKIDAPKLQFNAEPTISELSGRAMLNCSFAVTPNTGNDEVVLTFM